MASILQMSKTAENMVVAYAYDWAGSSNAFPDDKAKFDRIFEEQPTRDSSDCTLFKKWCDASSAAAKEEVLKEIAPLVKDTRWFAAYCGAVKNSIKIYCQQNEAVLLVCIEGGPITRVEAAEMPRLREEAMADLRELGVLTPSIEICSVSTFQEFEELVENKSIFEIIRAANVEEKALTEDMNTLLDNSHHTMLLEGQHHIKAGNLVEAKECFKLVTQQASELLPKELANAKLLLTYTTYKMGISSLQAKKIDDAAALFGEALEIRTNAVSIERLHKLQLFHACSLYEAGKQHREACDWGMAKKCFGAAKKTKALPSELKGKNKEYLDECDDMCEEVDDIELDASVTMKIDGNEAFELYKQAKRSMARGDANQARQLFEAAKQHDDVPKQLKKRAKGYIKELREYRGEEATTCVFSDNCTHLLSSTNMTLGLSTTTLGLLTTTTSTSTSKRISTSKLVSQEMVMVLDQDFPEPEARGQLITLMKSDVRKAMSILSDSEIQIRDIVAGSVVIYFCFVSGSSTFLEEKYLKQVDDKMSPLYQGKITSRIDQKRTQTMTMQLGSKLATKIPCTYKVGNSITLAQVEEERIECQVESLLGEGASATVFKVVTVANSKTCALKVFKTENSFVDLCEEASLMLATNHPQSHPVHQHN
jgi:tetratricopeptide (TPR) repeat protein